MSSFKKNKCHSLIHKKKLHHPKTTFHGIGLYEQIKEDLVLQA